MTEDYYEEPLVKDQNINTSTLALSTTSQSAMGLESQAEEDIGLISGEAKFNSIRQTYLRWVMLSFGCVFLMGSYFCFDIPATAFDTFEGEPYDLKAGQIQMMYTIYSLPNMVLPLAGGIFLDKIGVRIGLLLFTLVLTIGQFIFMIGGNRNVYWLMLVGRFVFGLGGECMSVSQSAIISQWFKGKELAFALGLNLTVSRMASVVGGIITPYLIADDDGLINSTMWVGSGLCVISLVAGILLVMVDKYADSQDKGKSNLAMSDEDKFQFRDILEFKLPFWLVSISCVFVYMSIFPFIQSLKIDMVAQYGFDTFTAGTLYSVPYFMSAGLAPILGIIIDKIGKRAMFITLSSILVALACFISAVIPYTTEPDWWCLLPLIMVGFGYSIYAAALWSSIPYIVPPRTIGSAFGLATSIQASGLVFAPLIVGQLENATPGRYVLTYFFLGSLSLVGLGFNIWLYIDDIKNRGGVLNNVATTVEEMMTSPKPPPRREMDDDVEVPEDVETNIVKETPIGGELLEVEGVVVFDQDPNARQALRRSMGKNSFAK